MRFGVICSRWRDLRVVVDPWNPATEYNPDFLTRGRLRVGEVLREGLVDAMAERGLGSQVNLAEIFVHLFGVFEVVEVVRRGWALGRLERWRRVGGWWTCWRIEY